MEDYDWKRFWCPRTGNVNLSDGGYLSDPDAEWGHVFNPDVVPFASVAHEQCLVLLGEPGIGKTHSLKVEFGSTESNIKAEGGLGFWMDLRSYGSEDRLVRNLFESPTFINWVYGEHVLHVFS